MTGRRALHVLMTADAVGGVWQYALTMARELTRRGDRVTLAVLGPAPSDDQRASAASIAGVTLMETGLALDWLSGDAAPVEEAARQLSAVALRIGADVVHCNSPALIGAAPIAVPVVAVTHGCVATWWQAAKDEPLAGDFAWHARLMRAGLLAADAVVAPSASFAETVQRTYRLPSSPSVVHNGRDPVRGSEPHRLDAALTVGRLWDPVKNAAVLDEAAGAIGVPFLAAGALQAPHGETFAPAHLQSLGELSEPALAALLVLRPVFVSAASFEPFGLAVLEAASAGCALVLSDIATFRELWDGAAVFVDSADAAGFRGAVQALIADPARRDELGEAARQRSARYTPAASAAAMRRIYEGLIAAEEVAA